MQERDSEGAEDLEIVRLQKRDPANAFRGEHRDWHKVRNDTVSRTLLVCASQVRHERVVRCAGAIVPNATEASAMQSLTLQEVHS